MVEFWLFMIWSALVGIGWMVSRIVRVVERKEHGDSVVPKPPENRARP